MTPDPRPDEVALPDGTRLLIRPIRPVDAPALVGLHGRLSFETIRRRYFGARPYLSATDVDRFTTVDGRVRFALVAMHGDDMVAVARYEGRVGENGVELALVVDDAMQNRGVGRVLLSRLVDAAREAGLHEMTADVLRSNAAMLALLRSVGLPQRSVAEAGTVTVTLDLTRLVLPPGRQQTAREHLRVADNTRPER